MRSCRVADCYPKCGLRSSQLPGSCHRPRPCINGNANARRSVAREHERGRLLDRTKKPIPERPTPPPQAAHSGRTADQILQGLKSHGLPIGVSFTYNAANDLNHDLGRPFQYIGKVNFKDTRISSTEQGAAISVSDGGSIEVFANESDTMHRFSYLQALSKSGSPFFVEYEYLDGVVILRISSQLTPDQAAKYQAALKALP